MKLKITFTVKTDIAATDDEVREWVDFNLHFNGQIKTANPLNAIDLETETCPSIIRDGKEI